MSRGPWALLLLTACTGTAWTRPPPGERRDGSVAPDAGLDAAVRFDAGGDAAGPDAAVEFDGGFDAGFDGGFDAGPGDPCADVRCMAHGRCIEGRCACVEGFVASGDQCVAEPVGDPASHTQAEVCARYRASLAVSSGYYVAGEAMCDPGTLTRGGIDDAVRRLNFFRWLTGLGPVSAEDPTDNLQAQHCAMTSAWNPAGPGAHFPEPSAVCYTPEAAAGAGSSNIAWGRQTGPSMIDQFMIDWGNDSTLGHRRWCLNPPLREVGVGIYHGGTSYGGASCLKVLGTGGGATGASPPENVPYPPPGFVPVELTRRQLWSLGGVRFSGEVTVTVTRASDGMAMPTTTMPLMGSYGQPTVAWRLDGWNPEPGDTYSVEVTDGATTVAYEVRPVSCP